MDLKFLDIAIGTIFIYLLLSLFASTVMELIATCLKMRSRDLKKTIQRMLDDEAALEPGTKKLSDAFYANPLIKYLAEVPKNEIVKSALPSYLTNKNFSQALFDEMLKIGQATGATYNDLHNSIIALEKNYPNSETIQFIKSLERDCEGNVENFKAALEQWFNDTMERATGWYKRKTQWILIYIGFFIAFFFNADTFQIVKYLSDNPKARTEMVQRAQKYLETNDNISKKGVIEADSNLIKRADSLVVDLSKQDKEILELTGAIGWKNGFLEGVADAFRHLSILEKLLGFLITALAISLGSTFWFDLLKKLINIRGAGKASNDDGSEKSNSITPISPSTSNVKPDTYRTQISKMSTHQITETPKPGSI